MCKLQSSILPAKFTRIQPRKIWKKKERFFPATKNARLIVSVCSHFCFVFFCFVIYTSMASCELDSSCGYTSKIPSVLIRQLSLESPWCLTASEQCWNVKKTEKLSSKWDIFYMIFTYQEVIRSPFLATMTCQQTC